MSRIFVGNVSSKGKIEDLRALFEDCGKIKYFGIKEGSGFMEFETAEEANEAISKLNKKEFCDQALIVEPSRKIATRMYKPNKGSFRERTNKGRVNSRSNSRQRRKYNRYKSRSRSRSRSNSRRNRHHRRHHHSSRRRSRSSKSN